MCAYQWTLLDTQILLVSIIMDSETANGLDVCNSYASIERTSLDAVYSHSGPVQGAAALSWWIVAKRHLGALSFTGCTREDTDKDTGRDTGRAQLVHSDCEVNKYEIAISKRINCETDGMPTKVDTKLFLLKNLE